MIDVFFTFGFGNLSESEKLGTCETVNECYSLMKQTLEKEGFEADYYRICDYKSGLVIDYGSHYNFFLIQGISFAEFTKKDKMLVKQSSPQILRYTIEVCIADPEKFKEEFPNFGLNYNSISEWCEKTLDNSFQNVNNLTFKITQI